MSRQFPFTKLPPELRLQIYEYGLPSRILQFSHNFPFPFLANPTNTLEQASVGTATRTTLPVLFHIWHESRAFCLSIYIPFAYSYAHPALDTLYFTRHAGSIIAMRNHNRDKLALPPLYPIILLKRVAIEIDINDLPKKEHREELPSQTLNDIKVGMKLFGFPKELLLVREAATPDTDKNAEGRVKGWDELELVEGTPSNEGTDDELVEFVTRSLLQSQRNLDDWLKHGIPKVWCMDVVKNSKITAPSYEKMSRLQARSEQTAREWLEAGVKGGKVYLDPWDTAKRLRRAKIKLPSEWGLDS